MYVLRSLLKNRGERALSALSLIDVVTSLDVHINLLDISKLADESKNWDFLLFGGIIVLIAPKDNQFILMGFQLSLDFSWSQVEVYQDFT